jgi:hypothetical protein
MSQSLAKLAGSDLVTLRPRLTLPAAAATAVRDCVGVPEALAQLEASGFLVEATRLVAHALPKREAVWWACMCAAHTAPPDLAEHDRLARETAESWVRQQTDTLRRSAMAHAEHTGFGSPEAWVAVAAFWCGDSMAPVDQPPVPPAPHLAGTAVAGAVALSAVRGDVTRQGTRLRRFLESARNIAAGGSGRLPTEETA